MRKISHRTIMGHFQGGWMTPQLQVQITPLSWGVGFVYQSTNKRPVKLGFRVGCVAVSVWAGKGYFESDRKYSNDIAHTFVEDK